MIRMRRMTPDVYYRQSRDFQFIGRLYDMVLNSVKTNSDLIYSLPNGSDADTALLDLLSMTLGFKSLHNYNVSQLKSLCSCFAEIIKNKGNIQSIQKACNALVGAEGINESVNIYEGDHKSGITIYVPQTLSDINLLRDLLNYILPAGLSYSIVKILRQEKSAETKVKVSHSVKIGGGSSSKISLIPSRGDAAPEFDKKEMSAPNVFATIGMTMNSTVVDGYNSNVTGVEKDTTLAKEYDNSPSDGEEAATVDALSDDATDTGGE